MYILGTIHKHNREKKEPTDYTRIIAAMEPSHKKEKVEANPQVNNIAEEK